MRFKGEVPRSHARQGKSSGIRRCITAAALACTAQWAPCAHADLNGLRFRVTADATYDDNVSRARGDDKLYDTFETLNLGASVPWQLSATSRLVLTGNAGGDKFQRLYRPRPALREHPGRTPVPRVREIQHAHLGRVHQAGRRLVRLQPARWIPHFRGRLGQEAADRQAVPVQCARLQPARRSQQGIRHQGSIVARQPRLRALAKADALLWSGRPGRRHRVDGQREARVFRYRGRPLSRTMYSPTRRDSLTGSRPTPALRPSATTSRWANTPRWTSPTVSRIRARTINRRP